MWLAKLCFYEHNLRVRRSVRRTGHLKLTATILALTELSKLVNFGQLLSLDLSRCRQLTVTALKWLNLPMGLR